MKTSDLGAGRSIAALSPSLLLSAANSGYLPSEAHIVVVFPCFSSICVSKASPFLHAPAPSSFVSDCAPVQLPFTALGRDHSFLLSKSFRTPPLVIKPVVARLRRRLIQTERGY